MLNYLDIKRFLSKDSSFVFPENSSHGGTETQRHGERHKQLITPPCPRVSVSVIKNKRGYPAALVCALAAALCVSCIDPMAVETNGNTRVLFTGLTAEATTDTSAARLILTFDKTINDLAAQDLSLESATGAVKGALTAKGSGAYTLELSGITASGAVTVTVSKSGYTIASPSRTVALPYQPPPDAAAKSAAFTAVTANGSATATTTALTLTFDADIPNLAAKDITLNGAGAQAGALTAQGNGEYTLTLTALTAGGGLSVTVHKDGYVFTPASRMTTVYYYAPLTATFQSVTAKEPQTQATTALTLTFDKDIPGLRLGDITLSGCSARGVSLDSNGSGVYELTLAALNEGGQVNVSVAKPDFSILDSSKTVAVYVAVAFNGLTADGSDTETTSALTLTFDKAIPDLTAADITLSGNTGARAGLLEWSGGGWYELTLTHITSTGELTVSVLKPHYIITPNGKSATVHLEPPVSNTIAITFTGPTDKTVIVTSTVFKNFSKSGGGYMALSVNDSDQFDRFQWLVEGNLIAEGSSVILEANMQDKDGNDIFKHGVNGITVLSYTGDIPWSGEVYVFANN